MAAQPRIIVRVKRRGLVSRVLQGATLNETTDRERAVRSRFTYTRRDGDDVYRLSLLGVLNGLIGLVLWTEDQP